MLCEKKAHFDYYVVVTDTQIGINRRKLSLVLESCLIVTEIRINSTALVVTLRP